MWVITERTIKLYTQQCTQKIGDIYLLHYNLFFKIYTVGANTVQFHINLRLYFNYTLVYMMHNLQILYKFLC